MKLLTTLSALILLPLVSFAQYAAPQIVYKCQPSGRINLDAGPTSGVITKIKSLDIPAFQNPQDYIVKLSVEGVTVENSLNDKNKPLPSEEIYRLKEMKSGTMFELKGEESNKYAFDAVFIEFGTPKVMTAGPIPEGTHKLTISLAFVDSNIYFSNPSPLTVKKVVLSCEMSLKY